MCYIFITLIEDFCLHQMDRSRRLITKPFRYQTTSSEEEAVIHPLKKGPNLATITDTEIDKDIGDLRRILEDSSTNMDKTNSIIYSQRQESQQTQSQSYTQQSHTQQSHTQQSHSQQSHTQQSHTQQSYTQDNLPQTSTNISQTYNIQPASNTYTTLPTLHTLTHNNNMNFLGPAASISTHTRTYTDGVIFNNNANSYILIDNDKCSYCFFLNFFHFRVNCFI